MSSHHTTGAQTARTRSMITTGRAMLIGVSALAMATASGLAAHHSFTAAFDANAPVDLRGVVTSVEWTNPHVRFSLDETASTGTTTAWRFELGAPRVLLEQGWTRHSLAPGDIVAVEGLRARDGTHHARVVRVTLENGQTVFADDPGTRDPG